MLAAWVVVLVVGVGSNVFAQTPGEERVTETLLQLRLGGVTNMTAEQLQAACGEARALGLRTVVHAHRPDGIRLAADAGCSQIEHAWLADREP